MYFVVLLIGYISQLFNKKVFFWIFAIILTLMAFVRYGIGLDYFGYQFLYDRLQLSVIDELKYGLDNQEIGFRTIGAFLKSIGFTYQQYLMVFAGVTILYVTKICRKYSNNPTLSLLIFFCFYYLTWTFGGIRQGLVISVGLYYLLKYIEKNNTIKFIFIVLLLSLIHSSAYILLVLYAVSKMNFKKNFLIIFAIGSIIISILPIGVMISKLTWLPFYNRIAPYLDMDMSLNTLDFQSFGRIIFLLVAFIVYEKYCEQNEMSKKIINMYIISLILYFVLQFSELTAGRLSIYGKYLDIIILSNVLYLYKKPINRLIYSYGILLLCSLYLFKEGSELERGYSKIEPSPFPMPYVNIFNKDDFYFHSEYFKLID